MRGKINIKCSVTPKHITTHGTNEVFVFGSNLFGHMEVVPLA